MKIKPYVFQLCCFFESSAKIFSLQCIFTLFQENKEKGLQRSSQFPEVYYEGTRARETPIRDEKESGVYATGLRSLQVNQIIRDKFNRRHMKVCLHQTLSLSTVYYNKVHNGSFTHFICYSQRHHWHSGKQVCIPIGCASPTCWPYPGWGRGVCIQGVWADPLKVCLQRGVVAQTPQSCHLWCMQVPPHGQTNTCENITLPQTSFAGGNINGGNNGYGLKR